jgi:GTP-binding protein EngB required for normal cell division
LKPATEAPVNEPQKRRIAITFQHVDELLRTAVQALSGEGADSPFCELIADAAPIQHRVASDHAKRIRNRMADALKRLGIPLRPPSIPATRSAFTHVMFAEVDIEDIAPKRLLGYGDLAPEDARALEDSCAEILALLGQMRTYLEAGPAADLEARLARGAAQGNLQPLLLELSRIISAHGLIALRPALERLVEALELDRFEIAVFGRVSSGKSSLLNHILGQSVLPVGVTPVTALVLHITYGPEPRAVIHFATAAPRVVSLQELPAYATEQENPGNRKQVSAIRVELPEERLQSGVTFVDTPGLGSLAKEGMAETLAYLPRADLGVVLTDATAALAPDDLLTLDALLRAGVRAMVLLSKADLLSPGDRPRVQDYATQRLRDELGQDIPVHLASVSGADVRLADHWFEAEIRPLLATHKAHRAQSLSRKAGLLRDSVLSLLRSQAGPSAAAAAMPPPAGLAEAEGMLRRAEGLPARALATCREHLRELTLAPGASISDAASLLDGVEDRAGARDRLAAALDDRMRPLHARILASMEELRQGLEQALKSAALSLGASPGDASPLSLSQGLPIFDATPVIQRLDWRGSPSHWLPAAFRKGRISLRLHAQLGSTLDQAFQSHRRRLEGWCQSHLAELERAFQERAGTLRALGEGPSMGGEVSADARRALESDIQSLERLGGSQP